MTRTIEGNLIAKGKKFGIIASRFNDFITKELVSGCLDTLVRHGAQDGDLTVAWVPGTFEIPMVAQKMAYYILIGVLLKQSNGRLLIS